MNLLNSFSRITRTAIFATLVFLLYGYLCRLLSLYFFWESKSIGWTLFWIAIILILRERIKSKMTQKKSTIPEKIGIGFCILILLAKGVIFFATQQTSAYDKALVFINADKSIREQVGSVNGVSLIPYGSFSMSSGPEGTQGQADLYFIIKGSKKYAELNLSMEKDTDTEWKIEIDH
jgi:hypothetical protein